ncbi:MAG TPA: hypothetical protein VEH84_17605 [Alphaproteobacteria bacterium]|nr:hypothetical protein [Alphaproteobacteria bacterium]
MARRWDPYTAAVLAAALLYVALALTPSSYGVVLERLGAAGEGPLLGAARPARSDEYGVWTPYFQMALRAGFARFETVTPFASDLRNFNSLPLLDWGLVFKPQWWGMFVLPPAWGFSLSHAVPIAAFLIGWRALLARLGLGAGAAAAGALLLFFAGYTQHWWTTTGPLLAFAPWPLLALTGAGPFWLRILGCGYAAAAALLSHLYPPLAIGLAFALAAAALALRPDWLAPRMLLAAALGGGLGLLAAWLYLAEVIPVMRATAYPGARLSPGGLAEPGLLLTLLHPFALAGDWRPLAPGLANENEAATVASLLPLLLAAFLDWRALAARLSGAEAGARRLRRALLVLAAAALLAAAWMAAPLPAWAGMPLGWHLVPGPRLVFPLGLLVLLAGLLLAGAAPWRPSWPRLALFALLAAALPLARAALGGAAPFAAWTDWLPPAAALAVLAAGTARAAPAGLAAAVAANAAAFGLYNPLQPAGPIVAPPETPALAALRREAAAAPEGLLASDMLAGAAPAGLGIPAAAHALIAPRPDAFRRWFPDMPEADFAATFNRYAHLHPLPVDRPAVAPEHADRIVLPQRRFMAPSPVAAADPAALRADAAGGGIDNARVLERRGDEILLMVQGWLPGGLAAGPLTVGAGAPVLAAEAFPLLRPDLPAATGRPETLGDGFRLALRLRAGAPPEALCLVQARADGRRLTPLRAGRPSCPLAGEAVAVTGEPPPPGLPAAGWIDAVEAAADGRTLRVTGWALLSEDPAARLRLHLAGGPAAAAATAVRTARPDVAAAVDPRLGRAGFEATVTLAAPLAGPPPLLCLASDDPAFGPARLQDRRGDGCAGR